MLCYRETHGNNKESMDSAFAFCAVIVNDKHTKPKFKKKLSG